MNQQRIVDQIQKNLKIYSICFKNFTTSFYELITLSTTSHFLISYQKLLLFIDSFSFSKYYLWLPNQFHSSLFSRKINQWLRRNFRLYHIHHANTSTLRLRINSWKLSSYFPSSFYSIHSTLNNHNFSSFSFARFNTYNIFQSIALKFICVCVWKEKKCCRKKWNLHKEAMKTFLSIQRSCSIFALVCLQFAFTDIKFFLCLIYLHAKIRRRKKKFYFSCINSWVESKEEKRCQVCRQIITYGRFREIPSVYFPLHRTLCSMSQ